MSEWKEVTLKDITQLVIDYRGKTPLKLGGNWSDHGYRALSAKNVKTGIIVAEESIRYVDEVLYKKWMKDEVQRGDILITSEAPFGEVFYWNSDEKIVLSQRLFDVRVKRDVCAQYVYYYMTSYPFQAELRSRASGTTVLGLKQPELLKAKVVLPDYETQQKIAAQLSEIDDKIAINRRICENLEAQAQALFKHWFIDFAPFKDDKFVESDLGMIPEGWRVVSLDDACIKITDGSHYSPKDDPHGTIPMLSVKDMRHNGFDYSSCKMINEEEYEKMKANDCIPLKNDILVAKDGSYLKEIFLCFNEERQAILSSIALFRCNINVLYPELLLQLLRLPRVRKDVGDNYVSGSALPRIVLKDFKKFRFVVAPIDVQNRIIDTMQSLTNEIHINEMESRKLAQLRDVLLPKLMSGQIKL